MTETFKPETVQQLQDLVRWAANEGEVLNITAQGSKAQLDNRPLSARGAVRVEMTALSGLTHYDPDDMVLTARAGTPLGEILDAVEAADQQLGFEPIVRAPWLKGQGPVVGTLGGMISSNLSGPRRLTAGAVRDHLLGFEAVSGRGEIYKAGGKVVKNVTGYDLMKLVCGSYGTLSILSEVTLRTQPGMKTAQSLLMGADHPDAAIALLTTALGSAFAVSAAAAVPVALLPDELRRHHLPSEWDAPWIAVARLEGHDRAVTERVHSLATLIKQDAPARCQHRWAGVESAALWARIAQGGPAVQAGDVLWRISVAPSQAAGLARKLSAQLRGAAFLFDWGGGLMWLKVTAPQSDQTNSGHHFSAESDCAESARRMRGAVTALGGHATLFIGAGAAVFHPLSSGEEALSRRIKTSFDPANILNPGRLFGAF